MGVIMEKPVRGQCGDGAALRVRGSHLPPLLALVLSKFSLVLQLHERLQWAGNSTFFHLYPGEKIQKTSAYLGKNGIAFGKRIMTRLKDAGRRVLRKPSLP